MIREALNREVRRVLTKRGWTQHLLAIRSGMTQKHVSDMLRGKSGAIEAYDLFAEALEIEFVIKVRKVRKVPR